MSAVKMNKKQLENLMKLFNGKLPVARVGILGSNNSRTGASSNAQIGLYHEFGVTRTTENGNVVKLPARSFLRIPLVEKLGAYLKNAQIEKATFKKEINKDEFVSFLKKIGLVAVKVVHDAFDSNGFGRWIPSNMEKKKNKQTLVETGQLRNSITSEVVE